MADFDLTEGLRKMFLAGVGAVATGAERTQEVVEEFVKKGELTVEQGKTLNQELTHKVKEVVENTSDTALRARLSSMTAEERAAEEAARIAHRAERAAYDAKQARKRAILKALREQERAQHT